MEIEKNKLKFLHIPKTGGSSVESLGLRVNILWGSKDNNYLKNFSQKNSVNLWHIPLHEFKKGNPYENHLVFTIIRHPVDRAISEYYFRNRGNKSKNYLNKWIRDNLARAKMRPNILDNHLLPQHKFIYNEDKLMITHILRFENIHEDFKNLMEEYNIPLEFDLHEKNYNNPFTREDLESETIELIKDFYKKDFELFYLV